MPAIGPVYHIGVAVRDLDQAERAYRALGAELRGRETVEGEGVEVSFVELGGVHIELLRPLGDEGGVARFLRERGQGVHHIAFRTPDITHSLHELSEQGIHPVGDGPRPGAGGRSVAFLHPRDTGGVLLELCEVKE